MAGTVTTLLGDLVFPEGLRWCGDTLWFSDMNGLTVMAVGPDGATRRVADVPGQPSGLGWLPDGRLLVVSMHDRRLLRLDPDGLVEHADLRGIATGDCNDMVVERHGRAYVGNFGVDFGRYIREHSLAYGFADPDFPTATLALVDPDGTVRVAAEGLRFPNGMVITPDGATLIVAETFGPRLTAFSIAADGTLHDRRVWAAMSGGIPDGICLDAEGAIWVASPPTHECLRLAAGGAVLDRVRIGQDCFSCALGGDDGRTLLLGAGPSPATPLVPGTRTGRIKMTRVGVSGTEMP